MKGQAFTVMKMMIGIAFAMILLVIVYTTTTNIDCPSDPFIDVRKLTLQAVNGPGVCFEITQLCIPEHTVITEEGLRANLPEIGIDIKDQSDIGCSGGKCDFERRYLIPVAIKCTDAPHCTIYFTKRCEDVA